LPDFKVRYLVLRRETDYGEYYKQTIVETINATDVERARAKAEDLATMRSKKTDKWYVRAVEQVN